jgi:hypothetical protein
VPETNVVLDSDLRTHKLKDSHFKMFIEEFNHWVKLFSIQGWEIMFTFPDDGVLDDQDYRACVMVQDITNRQVVCIVNREWDIPLTERNIRRTAFHEAMELFLMRYQIMAEDRFSTKKEMEEEAHNLIRSLENSVFAGSLPRRDGKVKRK